MAAPLDTPLVLQASSKCFQEAKNPDEIKMDESMRIHLRGYVLCNFCNFLENCSVALCRRVRQAVRIVAHRIFEAMMYWVDHFQRLFIAESTALAPLWYTMSRARAWAWAWCYRGRCFQATVYMGGRQRLSMVLFALVVRDHWAATFFLYYSIMLSAMRAFGSELRFQTCASRCW